MKCLNKKRHYVIFRNGAEKILEKNLDFLVILKNRRILDRPIFLFDIT